MLDKSVYQSRRDLLLQHIDTDSAVVLPAAPTVIRNRNIAYPYRQNSDFLYLSGFNEPDAVIVLLPGRNGNKFILFCQEHDQNLAIWHGKMQGIEGAIAQFAADEAYPISTIGHLLPDLLHGRHNVYYSMDINPVFDNYMIECLNRLSSSTTQFKSNLYQLKSLEYLLHEMRIYKCKHESSLIKTAVDISITAHNRAIKACRPNMYEYQLEAEIVNEIRQHGAHCAYPSIIGSGSNSCILHYLDNRDKLHDGDMVLIDAGAEYYGYSSDITRSIPVNGRFTEAQKEIYQLVLEASNEAIKQIKPGNHWDDPHRAAVETLTRGLRDLGLLKGRLQLLIQNEAYKRYFMHRTCHWLGLDVHDVGQYKIENHWRLLEPGMVLAVEPGLYMHSSNKNARRWINIGIRIEDVVQITNNGCNVLSNALAKDLTEIERLMA